MVVPGDNSPRQNHRAGPRLGRRLGHEIGKGFDEALGLAIGTVGSVGRVLGKRLHLLGRAGSDQPPSSRTLPGTAAGIEHMADLHTPPPLGRVIIRCIDYSPQRVQDVAVLDLESFLAEPRPEWSVVRWINVDGLHPFTVNRLRETFNFHTLAAEDVLHTHQRPRAEPYDGHLFIVTQMIMLIQQQLHSEQLSMFFFPGDQGLVLTFQETQGDMWGPIRDRIHTVGSRLRTNRADFLLYALIDSLIDHVFPILEHYGDCLESAELDLLEKPQPHVFQRVHAIKRDLLVLRRALWPMRQLVDDLWRDEEDRVEDATQAFFRDVYEHAVQIIDIIETYREISAGLTELYMSSVSQRLNEVMKVLTIISTIFVPLTFLAGVYGMNFQFLPELHFKYSYPLFWVVCLVLSGGLMTWFWRKGWLNRDR